MRKDVVKTDGPDNACQVEKKPNQKIPPALLNQIPAFKEPFNIVIIDCNTQMCSST